MKSLPWYILLIIGGALAVFVLPKVIGAVRAKVA